MNQFDEIVKCLDWPEAWKSVPSGYILRRLEDDSRYGQLQVGFTCDGDAWVNIFKNPDALSSILRFRTPIGGGQSQRVRTALMLLALAIEADNQERPQEGA